MIVSLAKLFRCGMPGHSLLVAVQETPALGRLWSSSCMPILIVAETLMHAEIRND